MQRHAQHGRDVRQRRRDVVAVADEGDRAAAAVTPPLAQRERIGERLTRMLLVGQRIDDVEVAAGGGDDGGLLLLEGANDQRANPSLEVSRDVLERFAHALGERAGRCSVSPPSSRMAISNVDRVRSDGFSNSSATCSPASACRWCLRSDSPIGLHLRRDRQQAIEIVRRQVENRQEVLGETRRRRASITIGTPR